MVPMCRGFSRRQYGDYISIIYLFGRPPLKTPLQEARGRPQSSSLKCSPFDYSLDAVSTLIADDWYRATFSSLQRPLRWLSVAHLQPEHARLGHGSRATLLALMRVADDPSYVAFMPRFGPRTVQLTPLVSQCADSFCPCGAAKVGRIPACRRCARSMLPACRGLVYHWAVLRSWVLAGRKGAERGKVAASLWGAHSVGAIVGRAFLTTGSCPAVGCRPAPGGLKGAGGLPACGEPTRSGLPLAGLCVPLPRVPRMGSGLYQGGGRGEGAGCQPVPGGRKGGGWLPACGRPTRSGLPMAGPGVPLGCAPRLRAAL